jgi:hypothetical protein
METPAIAICECSITAMIEARSAHLLDIAILMLVRDRPGVQTHANGACSDWRGHLGPWSPSLRPVDDEENKTTFFFGLRLLVALALVWLAVIEKMHDVLASHIRATHPGEHPRDHSPP